MYLACAWCVCCCVCGLLCLRSTRSVVVGVLIVGYNDSSLGFRLVGVSSRSIVYGKAVREVNLPVRNNRGGVVCGTGNRDLICSGRVPSRVSTFGAIVRLVARDRLGILSSLSRVSTINRHIIRNNRGCAGDIGFARRIIRSIRGVVPLTPLRGPTGLRNCGTYLRLLNPGIPRITIFSATFRDAVPPVTCVCTLPCRCFRGCKVHHCNFRNASRGCVDREYTRHVNIPLRGLGVVAYRLNGNSSVTTVGFNGIFSASVNFAPLSNFVVNAHSNNVSPSIMACLRRGLRLAPGRIRGVLGGRSNMDTVSNNCSSSHSVITGRGRNSRETVLTRRVRTCRVTGCVNSCITTVGNISTVIFANKVNRGKF